MNEFEIPNADPIEKPVEDEEFVDKSNAAEAVEVAEEPEVKPEEAVEVAEEPEVKPEEVMESRDEPETTPPSDPNSKEYTDYYMHNLWNSVSGEIAPPAAPSALPEATYETIQTNLKAFAGDVPYETWTK